MKTTGSTSTLLLAVSVLLVTASGALAKVRSEGADSSSAASAQHRQSIVVPLSTLGSEKSTRGTYWILKSSTLLASKGAAVSLLLFADGARLADTRSAQEFQEAGDSLPLWKLFDTFVEAGGEVLVESSSAEAVGLTAKDLRTGAKLATAEELADLILKSNKILSF